MSSLGLADACLGVFGDRFNSQLRKCACTAAYGYVAGLQGGEKFVSSHRRFDSLGLVEGTLWRQRFGRHHGAGNASEAAAVPVREQQPDGHHQRSRLSLLRHSVCICLCGTARYNCLGGAKRYGPPTEFTRLSELVTDRQTVCNFRGRVVLRGGVDISQNNVERRRVKFWAECSQSDRLATFGFHK